MPALLAEASDPPSMGSQQVSDDTITVLIVARDPILRAGVERQLLAMAEVTLLTPAAGRHPDVALVVADIIDDEVLGWIRTVRKHCLSRILVVAAVRGQAATWATEAGANGILPRSLADGRRLAWAVQKTHRGDGVMTVAETESSEPSVAVNARPHPQPRPATVSDRDREVLRLLAEGCDTGEIARILAYSEPTIKNVIQRLFEQLKAKNRPHAVALALRAGII